MPILPLILFEWSIRQENVKSLKKVIIIGGGLSGLIASIELIEAHFEVILIEKKKYPFHRVCGEYISNEVLSYLQRRNMLPQRSDIPQIQTFKFTSIKGKQVEMNLDLGGFGISRYELDNHLCMMAKSLGVYVLEQTSVISVEFDHEMFKLETSNGQFLEAPLVIGAYGKNSILDKKLNRDFTQKRSPFLGVKYHIRGNHPKHEVSLHNFEGGYCGLSAIEESKFNLCYLGSRETLKKYGSISEMEEAVLCKNPFLYEIFKNSEFLFDQPEVINEFSFAPKKLIENHILMAGDAAGLITPLSGNGMAMAIHSGKILADSIKCHTTELTFNRDAIEQDYSKQWNQLFKRRLWVGRKTQKLFGSKITSELTAVTMNSLPFIGRAIMKNTHGQPF